MTPSELAEAIVAANKTLNHYAECTLHGVPLNSSERGAALIARALLATTTRLAACEREFAEAIRALDLRTGMRNWENAIKSRVAVGVTEVRCDACGGCGTEARDRWDSSDNERTCQMCGGSGFVMQDVTPKSALNALSARGAEGGGRK